MTTKPAGRPPKDPSGAGRRFTVMLSPAQQQRALAFGGSVNFGVNEALRKSDELRAAPELLEALRAMLLNHDEYSLIVKRQIPTWPHTDAWPETAAKARAALK